MTQGYYRDIDRAIAEAAEEHLKTQRKQAILFDPQRGYDVQPLDYGYDPTVWVLIFTI